MTGSVLAKFLTPVMLRVCLAANALGIVGFVVALGLGHDDPLRSDDPYILGFLFGGFAACSAIVYTIFENVGRRCNRPYLTEVGYVSAIAVWCLLLWLASLRAPEMPEVLIYMAIASAAVGLLAYPLCRFVPRAS